MKFSSLSLSSHLLDVVKELGFDTLTPIQAKSIPLLLEGKDIIGQAKTGSGKTAAFALPILERIELHNRNRILQALILCPTRELCTQVAREFRKLGRKNAGLQVLIVSGGQPIGPQLAALEKGVHIVVGTPGRVLDHLDRRSIDLRKLKTLVLDEADRMLDMGFQDDMESILSATPKSRQTAFFSATFPNSIERMSRQFQNNPVEIKIESEIETAPDIKEVFYECSLDQKPMALLHLLKQYQPEGVIIFCNLKATVAELNRTLLNEGVSSGCLHGDLEQYDRDRVLAKFRNHSLRVLVATDVAARGLDIESLDAVINYDLPSQPEIYVHRIGRTGRADKSGLALSLGASRDHFKIEMIEEFTTRTLKKEKLNLKASTPQVTSPKRDLHKEAKMQTLRISGGRKEKVRPGDILGALTGEAAGLKASEVGKIEIHDHFSYVAVASSIAQEAYNRLQSGRIKGRHFRVDWVK